MYVLIVDSQPLLRKGVKQVLASYYEGINIVEAGDYNTAVNELKGKNFDIVISDIHLEGSNCFSLIEKIKLQNNKAKILIMTASNNIHDFLKARTLKVDGYILKNAFVEDFIYAIKVILRGESFFNTKVVEKIMNNEVFGISALTNREREVFEQLSLGLSNSQISKILYISEATTKKHISNILNKLNLSNRIEVVFYAKQLNESY